MSCSTVFKSCQDDGRKMMKRCCNGTPFTSERISNSDRARTRNRLISRPEPIIIELIFQALLSGFNHSSQQYTDDGQMTCDFMAF